MKEEINGDGVEVKSEIASPAKDYKAEMLSFQSQFRPEPKVQPSAAVAEEAKDAVKPEQNGKGGEKRKAQFPQLFSPNAAKKSKNDPAKPKNACVALNEYKPGLPYIFLDQTGLSHEPIFRIKVTVNGTDFIGKGRSKKLAKQAAAENALKSMIQFKNPLEAQVAMGLIPPAAVGPVDFTADQTAPLGMSTDDIKTEDIKTEAKSPKTPPPAVEPVKPKGPVVNEFKNPIMSLNELRKGLIYDTIESSSTTPTKRFTTSVVIDGARFEGHGASKKLAKQACARATLSKLYGASFTPTVTTKNSSSAPADKMVAGTQIPLSKFSMDQEVADQVAKMILERFEELVEGNMVASRRKVIAGIVMSRGGKEMTELSIISVTTGTKCINGEYMSASGKGLNDSHAEILSRRCLVRYLYSQLEKIASNAGNIPEDSILEKGSMGGYKIKEDVRFHLYINTAPCGDARIFSPHEDKLIENGLSVVGLDKQETDRHVNRRSRGQLRTKIESGEGTIPVSSADGIQTWDGVMQGSRLLTMSCSDKICKWNVVGVQGALLAYFIEPVYFYSIVLGSLFHATHMLRAVAGRIEKTLTGLPPNYRLNTPKLNLLSSPEARQPRKSPNHSVNWTQGDQKEEIVDATKGKLLEAGRIGQNSRLCKHTLFLRWLSLAGNEHVSRLVEIPKLMPTVYSLAKAGSNQFQCSKTQLYRAFKTANLGDWVKKPMEQDEFEI